SKSLTGLFSVFRRIQTRQFCFYLLRITYLLQKDSHYNSDIKNQESEFTYSGYLNQPVCSSANWLLYRSAEKPSFCMSSLWVPCSMTSPWSITRILSAS